MGVDVALDLLRFRSISAGMGAYSEELAARLPRVAPDLSFATVVRTDALSLAEQVRAPRALRAVGPRLVHHLAFYAPVFAPRPTIVTVHDLIHLRFPKLFKGSVGPYYATVVRAVCARAARVITDDERTVADLERFLGVPPRKVVVIPLGVDDSYREPVAHANGQTRPYFLNVGNHRPHKNLKTLFAAWASLPTDDDIDLLLTGPEDVDAGEIPTRANGSVRFLGDVPVAQLRALYRGATALVHPALCEGFGLPMLEAATVGTAVIASTDAVPSVLRPYCDVFETLDVSALRASLARALRAPAPREEALAFARTLTWDRCARQTAEVYRTVLPEKNRR
jgi:glycosyltransferase involved in cell wall biosynthesis